MIWLQLLIDLYLLVAIIQARRRESAYLGALRLLSGAFGQLDEEGQA